MDVVRRFEAKFKDSHPVHYLLMKIVVACILMCCLFFVVTMLGVWTDIEVVRFGGMILFGTAFVVGFISFLLMLPVYIYSIWQRK